MPNGDGPGEVELRAEVTFTPEGIPIAVPVLVTEPGPAVPPAHDMLITDSSRGSAFVDIVVVLLGLVVFEFLSQLLLSFATGIGDLPENASDADITRILILPVLPARAALVTIVLAMLLAWRHQSLRSLGITVDRLVINILLGLVALGAAYGLIIPWAVAMQVFAPETAKGFHENAEAIMSFVPRQAPLRFLWLALVIGFYEELFFCGFLMTRLRRLLGGWTWAAIVSSIVFIAPHMIEQKPIALVPIAILAAIFCVVTIWRRSIVPALIAHWLFNLSQFLLLYYTSGDTWQ